MFDFLKYSYVVLENRNIHCLYAEAEQLEKIGYMVVNNGVFRNHSGKYKMKMRKPKKLTKMAYLNMFGSVFVIVAIFSAFVVGYSINTHEANIKDVVKQTLQDISYISFCIGMICGVLLEAVILLKR